MSSLIGHVAAGAAIYLSERSLRDRHVRWALPCFVLLAILPDFDYFAIWFFGIKQSVRITHTVAFCLLAGWMTWRIARRILGDHAATPEIGKAGFILAPLSHLLLDFLVGAHSLPLLWPFPDPYLMSPMAVLPTAIHVYDLRNYYVWRNVILEAVILVPSLMFLGACARKVEARTLARHTIRWMPLWTMALAYSIVLPR